MNEIKLYAVAGYPILFSRSPQLYNTAFKEWNFNSRYLRLSSSSGQEVLKTVRELKISGLNITSPLKKEVIPFLDELDEVSSTTRAANTIIPKGKSFKGYNTDPDGVRGALRAHCVSPGGKSVLVLGAGGAACAAAYALIQDKARKVTLANRTERKAEAAARCLGCDFLPQKKLKDSLHLFDIIVSCIPDTREVLKPIDLPPTVVLLEAGYGHSTLPNLPQTGNPKGPFFIHGLEWLFYQGLPVLRLYTGRTISQKLKEKIREAIYSAPEKKTNVALIGFMAAGKSTLGRMIARKLRWAFLDTDEIIAQSTGCSIPQIFQLKGEKFFREIESSEIKPLFQKSRKTVFSLGGGAVLNEEIRRHLRKSCLTVWVWSPLPEILSRAGHLSRPLLSSLGHTADVEKLVDSRIPFYAEVADIVIPNPEGKIQLTFRRIIHEIHPAILD